MRRTIRAVCLPIAVMALAMAGFAWLTPVLAATPALAAAEPNTAKMAMGLLGGLALFLFGMEQMSDGLKAAAGNSMKTLLGKLTRNRIAAALTGATVTAVIQSSSVTTVLVVGFVSAGLMTLPQSIGVIMGANVGTTITAQIVAFKVEEAALLIIAVGFAMLFLSKNERVKHYGNIIMGLGMVFFGMSTMSEAMEPLRTYQPFIDLMAQMENPLLGILAAAVFTALVQSSSATTGIVIAMASQGLVTLPAGIALVFGSNIGTCVTALLAAIGKATEARRVAAVHVMFNVIGVMIWVLFIPQLAAIVVDVSPSSPDLDGTARLAAEVPRQVANAHTVFNIANTILFLFFTTQFARLVERLVPEREEKAVVIIEPKFLDPALIDTPALALDRVRMELGHLGEVTRTMLSQIRDALLAGSHEALDKVAGLDDRADILHAAIIEYLNDIMKDELTEEEQDLTLRYLRVGEDLERIGDVIETELVAVGHRAVDAGIKPTDTTDYVLGRLYEKVCAGVDDAIRAIAEEDELAAQAVINMKPDVNALIDDAVVYQAQRLTTAGDAAMSPTRLENEVIDGLKRIYSLSKRIAKLVVPAAMLASSG